jgi:hypothetical protein
VIGLIRAADIDRWASRVISPPEFPRLVRRLVYATANGLKQVDFPADEAIRLAGWDGKVLTEKGTPFVPEGFSAWELGTSQDPKSKANEDYEKRTADSVGVLRLEATFVFATPRHWPGKAAWATEKCAEGKWKDVAVVDAEDFSQWLESAPGVAAWFGPLAGCVPGDVRSLEESCSEYCASTNPPLDLSCLLLGRDAERTRLLDLLRGPPSGIDISATTAMEAMTFIGACIDSLPEVERDSLWAKTICVETPKSLRTLAASDRPLVLVVSDQAIAISNAATLHHIVRPHRGLAGTSSNSLELGSQPIRSLVDYFAGKGLDRNEAYQLCHEAAGHLERIRRPLLAVPPPRPEWSHAPTSVVVAAICLIGAWDESNDADRSIVSNTSAVSYEDFVRAITPFQTGPEPLVNRAGTVWKIHSRETAWKHLEGSLTARQLETFLESVEAVLLDDDPRFELEPSERWMANAHGKKRLHSAQIREGLVGGLVHAAVLGKDAAACYKGYRPQSWVDGTCRRLFEHRQEPNFWRRLRDELRELAEASPDEFLTAIDADLAGESPQVCDLFEDEGDNGACLHSDLLWALEILAWAPEHVGRVALTLAALSERDPGGRWSNRPHNTLVQMLLPVRPQCAATAAQRPQLLDLLIQRFPLVGWTLGTALMPTQSTITTATARPTLRTWARGKDDGPVMVSDYWQEVRGVSERLVHLAGTEAERWKFLLSNLNSLFPDLRDAVLKGAAGLDERLQGRERISFWTKLRKLLHHHNQFSGKEKIDWVYPREVLDQLEAIYTSLAPTDPVERAAWLFAFHVERPMNVSFDWQEEQDKIEQEQAEAAEELARLAVADLAAALPQFENPHRLGYCLGQCSRADSLESTIVKTFASSSIATERGLVQGFAAALQKAKGAAFVSRWCSKGSPEFLSAVGAATILQGLPTTPDTWDIVEAVGKECHVAFWNDVYIHLFKEPRYAERAARNLLSVGRALAAIDLLAANVGTKWLSKEGDIGRVVEALKAGVAESNDHPDRAQRVAYDIAALIKALAESKRLDAAELLQLEWMYFGLLEYQAEHDLVIYERLIADPEALLQLIGFIYLPDGASRDERPAPTEAEKKVASQAWRILHDWKPFLKTAPNAMPTAQQLKEFIERARQLANERGFSSIVDDYLGKALSSAPAGADGVWPHEVVRDVIELYGSRALEDGFCSGKQNARGVTTRSPGDGGSQERELAETYETAQKALAIVKPRTSTLLGRLVEVYRSQAQWEDNEMLKRG